MAVDVGVTHVALPATDIDATLAFWRRYAGMEVVHERRDPRTGTRVVWISDRTRPFVIVFIENAQVDHCLGGAYCHVGVGVESRETIDRLCAQARADDLTVLGPIDSGPPVGYWAYIVDPDGHNLELSFGQEVGLTVSG